MVYVYVCIYIYIYKIGPGDDGRLPGPAAAPPLPGGPRLPTLIIMTIIIVIMIIIRRRRRRRMMMMIIGRLRKWTNGARAYLFPQSVQIHYAQSPY